MMSDRPIGVMLSGGVDSAAIAAVVAKHSPHMRTFTVGFEGGGAGTNEIPQARETARLLGAEHESVVVGANEYLERLPDSLLTLEEPVGSTSALAVRFVAQLMKPTVPVALTGQGADEPLGGYGRHLGVKLATELRKVAPLTRPLARLADRTTNPQLRRGLATLDAKGDAELLLSAYSIFQEPDKQRLYGPRMRGLIGDPELAEVVERHRRRVAKLPPLAQMLYVDTRLTLPDELLLIADKMSMAESVELRVPFLDEDLVALVESMEPSQKVHGRTGKWIHKKAMERLLPEQIVHRRKLGWDTPLDRWLRAELRPLLEEVLLGEGELCRDLFEESELRRLLTHARARRARPHEAAVPPAEPRPLASRLRGRGRPGRSQPLGLPTFPAVPDRRHIAMFDSGVGGLTVLHECLVSLPHEDFVYLGDTARFPYGVREAGELREFALELAELLLDEGAKLLVVACNAATVRRAAGAAERFGNVCGRGPARVAAGGRRHAQRPRGPAGHAGHRGQRLLRASPRGGRAGRRPVRGRLPGACAADPGRRGVRRSAWWTASRATASRSGRRGSTP